jgi:ribonuclease-3
MDLGLLHAKEFVLRIYNDPNFIDLNKIMIDDNFKDHLMKYCQIMNIPLPEYRVVGHHEGIFYIDTYINGQFGGRGEAKSKKQAEQLAARAFFEQLKNYPQQ